MKAIAIGDIVRVSFHKDAPSFTGTIIQQYPSRVVKNKMGQMTILKSDRIEHLTDSEAMLWKLENE